MIDLHTHSTASDGSDSPSAVVDAAAAAGCSAFALTDHDSVDGLHEASNRANEVGVEVVGGCELSCEVLRGTMHLLVYFVEPGRGPLDEALDRLQRIRDERNRKMADRLCGLGLEVSYEEMWEEAGGAGIGRPHAASILVRKGYASSLSDAFDRYLARGKPGYVEKERLSPERAINLAVESGGVAVLAHPFTLGLNRTALASRLRELRSAGLAGIEAIYGRYSPEEREDLAGLARELDLVATGGSDYHGSYKPDLSIGTGTGDLSVPDSVLEELSARRR
jgi:hypothetical protein